MGDIKTIVISGYYGFDNSGDDAILKAIVKGFKASNRELDLIVLSNNPPSTEKIYGVRAVDRFSPVEVRRAIKSCDLFISGGGSLLQDVTSTRSLIYYLATMSLAHFYRKKVMVYSNGVGPISKKSNRVLTRKLLEKVDMITLRDEESRSFVEELGVKNKNIEVTADPVFGLEAIDSSRARAILKAEGISLDRPLVGISLRDWTQNEILVDKMARATDYMVEKFGVDIVLVPMHYPEDLTISRELIERAESDSIYLLEEEYKVDELMGVINEFDMILAMRLHSLIYAATQAVPMLGLVYDPKIVGFLKTIEIDNMVDVEDLDYEELIRNIDEVWENRETMAEAIGVHGDRLEERARENIAIALDLLEK